MGRKISRREKTFLAAAGLIALVFLASKWLFLPFFREALGARERIDEGLAVIEAYQTVVAREGGLLEENRLLDAALQEYRGVLLSGGTPPLAAAELETKLKEMAGRTGLNIVSQKILASIPGEHFLEVPIQIVATGEIGNFRDFIVLLETSRISIGIREMNLRSLGARNPARARRPGGKTGGIQATMTVAGFIPS